MEFKLVLIGDANVGKTALATRLLTGKFVDAYFATMGVQVHSVRFETNRGPVVFNVWDISGREDLGGLRDGFFIGSSCAILMFDVTSPDSYSKLPSLHDKVTTVCGEIPVAVVCNKTDLKEPGSEVLSLELEFFDMSVKAGSNLDLPFLYLAKRLALDPSLSFLRPQSLGGGQARSSSPEAFKSAPL